MDVIVTYLRKKYTQEQVNSILSTAIGIISGFAVMAFVNPINSFEDLLVRAIITYCIFSIMVALNKNGRKNS